jgi:hypothetical protein
LLWSDVIWCNCNNHHLIILLSELFIW